MEYEPQRLRENEIINERTRQRKRECELLQRKRRKLERKLEREQHELQREQREQKQSDALERYLFENELPWLSTATGLKEYKSIDTFGDNRTRHGIHEITIISPGDMKA